MNGLISLAAGPRSDRRGQEIKRLYSTDNLANDRTQCAMKTIVQKYGGSSLSDVASIRRVARRVIAKQEQGLALLVVVSAMGDTTDRLLELARQAASSTPRRELDLLLSTGEVQSAALLSMTLQNMGAPAVALSARQCGILTNDVHLNARIVEIRPSRIIAELAAGRIVVATGFQGISAADNLTTLGRGGSDLTAIALAAAVGAEYCEILTDVDGIFDADPRIVAGARRIERTSHQVVEAFACHGARVLKGEAVEFAKDHGIAIRVLSSFADDRGAGRATVVGSLGNGSGRGQGRSFFPNRPTYTGTAGRKDLVRLSFTVSEPANWREIATSVAQYDLVFGNVGCQGARCAVFLSSEEIPDLEFFAETLKKDYAAAQLEVSAALGALSLVGFGLGSRPAALFGAIALLNQAGIEVLESFTDRESLTFVVAAAEVDEGMRLLHSHYLADSEPAARSRDGRQPRQPQAAI